MSKALISLRGANLNLMPTLRALLREESVTRAAAAVNLSPSAVSCALAELRLLFDDPLLMRVGRTMHRTPKAEMLIGKLEQACLALEDLLHGQTFDPATAQRTFVVAAIDYLALLLAPGLLAQLREEAPGVRVRFVDMPGDLERRLARNSIDMGLAAVNVLFLSGLGSGPRFVDKMVGLVDAAHPVAALEHPGVDDLAEHPSLEWEPGLDLAARVGAFERIRSLQDPPAQCLLPSYAALPLAVMGTRMVARVPAALARRLTTQLPLRMFDLPYEPLIIETSVLWNLIHDADPAHRWFRDLLHRHMKEAHA